MKTKKSKTSKKMVKSMTVQFCNGRYFVTFYRHNSRKNAKLITKTYSFSGTNMFLSNIFFNLANDRVNLFSYSHFNEYPCTNIYTRFSYDEARIERMK